MYAADTSHIHPILRSSFLRVSFSLSLASSHSLSFSFTILREAACGFSLSSSFMVDFVSFAPKQLLTSYHLLSLSPHTVSFGRTNFARANDIIAKVSMYSAVGLSSRIEVLMTEGTTARGESRERVDVYASAVPAVAGVN